jgi:hypothetical protein
VQIRARKGGNLSRFDVCLFKVNKIKIGGKEDAAKNKHKYQRRTGFGATGIRCKWPK